MIHEQCTSNSIYNLCLYENNIVVVSILAKGRAPFVEGVDLRPVSTQLSGDLRRKNTKH